MKHFTEAHVIFHFLNITRVRQPIIYTINNTDICFLIQKKKYGHYAGIKRFYCLHSVRRSKRRRTENKKTRAGWFDFDAVTSRDQK